jgi:uncharacterized OsmC-like protein
MEETMSDVVYVSKSSIERKQGPLRIAQLPGESQPVIFSVHGAIAEHYKVDPAKLKESHSSTIDYVIGATAGWMMGTFGGALEARQIDASNGRLTADVTGEVETEEGVLVIRRIHVAMRLVAPEESRGSVERVHGIYAMRCPLYRTLHEAIQLTSSFELVAPTAVGWRHSEERSKQKTQTEDRADPASTGAVAYIPETRAACPCRLIHIFGFRVLSPLFGSGLTSFGWRQELRAGLGEQRQPFHPAAFRSRVENRRRADSRIGSISADWLFSENASGATVVESCSHRRSAPGVADGLSVVFHLVDPILVFLPKCRMAANERH